MYQSFDINQLCYQRNVLWGTRYSGTNKWRWGRDTWTSAWIFIPSCIWFLQDMGHSVISRSILWVVRYTHTWLMGCWHICSYSVLSQNNVLSTWHRVIMDIDNVKWCGEDWPRDLNWKQLEHNHYNICEYYHMRSVVLVKLPSSFS